MVIVSVTYNYSPDFDSPDNWFKRTRAYMGILEFLAKKDTIIYVKQINYAGDYIHNGIQARFVDFGRKDTFFPFRLNRFIKSLKPDVVLLQGLHNPLQFIQLALLLNKRTKVIAHHHAEKPFTGIKKQLQKLADKYIDANMFASHLLGMDWFNSGIIANKNKIHEVMEISSVFSPIDKMLAKAHTGIKSAPVFLWVGRLNQNKDPLTVVNAFLKFALSYPSSMLYMIYQTTELLPDINRALENHPAQNSIVLVGQKPNDELLYWYNSADFILSGSHYEGGGTAICEAVSCGCVPVITDIPSFRMITNNGKCGLLYEAGNEKALLTALLQTPEINLTEKGKMCIDYFKSNLSFEAIADRIREIAYSL